MEVHCLTLRRFALRIKQIDAADLHPFLGQRMQGVGVSLVDASRIELGGDRALGECGLDDVLVHERALGPVALGFPAREHMARQTAVHETARRTFLEVQWRLRRPVPRLARHVERIAVESRR